MLEGEPGTLESLEELTLPGEVSGCWGEGEGEGGRVGMCVCARAAGGLRTAKESGVQCCWQPPDGTTDSRPAPPRALQCPRTLGRRRAHLLQPVHAAGSWRVGSPAGGLCVRVEGRRPGVRLCQAPGRRALGAVRADRAFPRAVASSSLGDSPGRRPTRGSRALPVRPDRLRLSIRAFRESRRTWTEPGGMWKGLIWV